MHDQLTLILPIRDRIHFMRRWFQQARTFSFPWRILVADGSQGAQNSDFFACPEHFQGLHVEHQKYETPDDYGGFMERISLSLDKVETPYVLIVADDDFFLPSGILRSLRFLEKNPDYMAARGEILDFTIPGKNGQNAYGDMEFYFSEHYNVPSRNADNVYTRLAQQCDKYCCALTTVQRTAQARKRFSYLRHINARETWLPLMFDDFGLLAQGKTHHGKHLYGLKQTNAIGSEAHAIYEKDPSILDWMTRPGWSKEMSKLVPYVTREIAEAQNIPYATAHAEFKRLFIARYLSRLIRVKGKGEGTALPGTIARKLEKWRHALKRKIIFKSRYLRAQAALKRFQKSEEVSELQTILDICRTPYDPAGKAPHGEAQ